MSSGNSLIDLLKDTVLPEWIVDSFFTPAKPRQIESHALEAFRQRIFMQQVN